jgi:hypothetical protein
MTRENITHPVPTAPLRITPAKRGSGKTDVSLRHDDYLAQR